MHILSPETDNCPSWISGRERMTVENISWSVSTKECCRPRRGLNPRPPGLQSDGASNWATEAGQWVNEETLSINNLGGLLFQADLEKNNKVSESIRADFYSWRILEKICLHQCLRVRLDSENNKCPGVLCQNFLKSVILLLGVHLESRWICLKFSYG